MQSTQTVLLRRAAEALGRRYDPEHDTIPGAPAVTYTDNELLEMIKRLVIVVEDLQDQINGVDARAERDFNNTHRGY